jgi:hypothetical protein
MNSAYPRCSIISSYFSYSTLDIDRSRSFGIITRTPTLVREATRLFEADTTRQAYTAACSCFLVSPLNSRDALGRFIAGAKNSLDIYDPGLRDREMVRLLDDRAAAGVEIRVLGKFRKGQRRYPFAFPRAAPPARARRRPRRQRSIKVQVRSKTIGVIQ